MIAIYYSNYNFLVKFQYFQVFVKRIHFHFDNGKLTSHVCNLTNRFLNGQKWKPSKVSFPTVTLLSTIWISIFLSFLLISALFSLFLFTKFLWRRRKEWVRRNLVENSFFIHPQGAPKCSSISKRMKRRLAYCVFSVRLVLIEVWTLVQGHMVNRLLTIHPSGLRHRKLDTSHRHLRASYGTCFRMKTWKSSPWWSLRSEMTTAVPQAPASTKRRSSHLIRHR